MKSCSPLHLYGPKLAWSADTYVQFTVKVVNLDPSWTEYHLYERTLNKKEKRRNWTKLSVERNNTVPHGSQIKSHSGEKPLYSTSQPSTTWWSNLKLIVGKKNSIPPVNTVIRPKAPSGKNPLFHQLMKSLRWEKRHSVVGKKTLYSISQHCTTQWSDQKLLVGKTLYSTSWWKVWGGKKDTL